MRNLTFIKYLYTSVAVCKGILLGVSTKTKQYPPILWCSSQLKFVKFDLSRLEVQTLYFLLRGLWIQPESSPL